MFMCDEIQTENWFDKFGWCSRLVCLCIRGQQIMLVLQGAGKE